MCRILVLQAHQNSWLSRGFWYGSSTSALWCLRVHNLFYIQIRRTDWGWSSLSRLQTHVSFWTCYHYILFIVICQGVSWTKSEKKPNFQRTFCRHLLAFAGRLGRRVFFFLHLIIPERSNWSHNSLCGKDLARFWLAGERFFSPRFLPCNMVAGEAFSRFSGVHLKKKF